MKALLIVLAVLFLLAMIKIGVHVFYEEKKLKLDVLIFKFRITLIGKENSGKKPKQKKKEKPQKAQVQKKERAPAEKSKSSGGFQKLKPWLNSLLDYWQEIFLLVGRVLTTPTLDVLRLEIVVGAADAEACAMKYGKICAITGAVLPVVENTFTVKKRKIDVACMFDRESMEISGETAITVRVYEIFALAFALLGLGLKILLQARKYKKAVQQYESSSS